MEEIRPSNALLPARHANSETVLNLDMRSIKTEPLDTEHNNITGISIKLEPQDDDTMENNCTFKSKSVNVTTPDSIKPVNSIKLEPVLAEENSTPRNISEMTDVGVASDSDGDTLSAVDSESTVTADDTDTDIDSNSTVLTNKIYRKKRKVSSRVNNETSNCGDLKDPHKSVQQTLASTDIKTAIKQELEADFDNNKQNTCNAVDFTGLNISIKEERCSNIDTSNSQFNFRQSEERESVNENKYAKQIATDIFSSENTINNGIPSGGTSKNLSSHFSNFVSNDEVNSNLKESHCSVSIEETNSNAAVESNLKRSQCSVSNKKMSSLDSTCHVKRGIEDCELPKKKSLKSTPVSEKFSPINSNTENESGVEFQEETHSNKTTISSPPYYTSSSKSFKSIENDSRCFSRELFALSEKIFKICKSDIEECIDFLNKKYGPQKNIFPFLHSNKKQIPVRPKEASIGETVTQNTRFATEIFTTSENTTSFDATISSCQNSENTPSANEMCSAAEEHKIIHTTNEKLSSEQDSTEEIDSTTENFEIGSKSKATCSNVHSEKNIPSKETSSEFPIPKKVTPEFNIQNTSVELKSHLEIGEKCTPIPSNEELKKILETAILLTKPLSVVNNKSRSDNSSLESAGINEIASSETDEIIFDCEIAPPAAAIHDSNSSIPDDDVQILTIKRKKNSSVNSDSAFKKQNVQNKPISKPFEKKLQTPNITCENGKMKFPHPSAIKKEDDLSLTSNVSFSNETNNCGVSCKRQIADETKNAKKYKFTTNFSSGQTCPSESVLSSSNKIKILIRSSDQNSTNISVYSENAIGSKPRASENENGKSLQLKTEPLSSDTNVRCFKETELTAPKLQTNNYASSSNKILNTVNVSKPPVCDRKPQIFIESNAETSSEANVSSLGQTERDYLFDCAVSSSGQNCNPNKIINLLNSMCDPKPDVNEKQPFDLFQIKKETPLEASIPCSSQNITNYVEVPANYPTTLFKDRKGKNLPSSLKCLHKNIGKHFMDNNDLSSLILEWNVNWLLIHEQMKTSPPICEEYVPIKDSYRDKLEYYNTYFPLHLLSIWLGISDAWKQCLPFLETVLENEIEKSNFVKITLSSVLPTSTLSLWPKKEDLVIMCTTAESGEIVGNLFGRVFNVMVKDYNPPVDSMLKGQAVKKMKIELFSAELLNVSVQTTVKIQVLNNIRVPFLENDALQHFNILMENVILDPKKHKSSWKFLSLRSLDSYSLDNLKENIHHSVTSRTILITVVNTTINVFPAMSQLVTYLKSKNFPVFISLKSEEHFLKLAKELKDFNLVLAVKSKEMELPSELQKFTLEELSETTSSHEIFKDWHVTLTLFSRIFLGNFKSAFANQNLTCLVYEAHNYTEPETALLLYYGVENLILIGNREFQIDMRPLLKSYKYNVSLFNRFCNVHCSNIT